MAIKYPKHIVKNMECPKQIERSRSTQYGKAFMMIPWQSTQYGTFIIKDLAETIAKTGAIIADVDGL